MEWNKLTPLMYDMQLMKGWNYKILTVREKKAKIEVNVTKKGIQVASCRVYTTKYYEKRITTNTKNYSWE
jgi:uroporphyrinogen-III synthase